jgi:uncharacterized protein YcfJ
MITPPRGCEEPFEPEIDVEVEVTIGVVGGAMGGGVGEAMGGGVGEAMGGGVGRVMGGGVVIAAVQQLVQILDTYGESHTANITLIICNIESTISAYNNLAARTTLKNKIDVRLWDTTSARDTYRSQDHQLHR